MAINANEQNGNEAPTSAGGLFQSLSNFGGTLLGIAHTRLQLLTTELQEEVHRTAQLLVWAFVAIFAAMLALFLGALTIIFAFWDTHRLAAALVMTGVLFALAIVAALVLRNKLKTRPPMLDATLGELAKDREQLRKSV